MCTSALKKEMLREGAIGTTVGTYAAAAGPIWLAAANISPFIACRTAGRLEPGGSGVPTTVSVF